MSHQDTMTSLRLLGQEVLPAVREMGKELGLTGPDECKLVSRPLQPPGNGRL